MRIRSIIEALHRANQAAFAAYMSASVPGDVTPRQFAVLAAISEKEGLSQTDLTEITGIDRSTLADIVRRMHEREWLRRVRTKEAARAYSVMLTPKGADLFKKASPAVAAIDARLKDCLTQKEQALLMGFLEKLAGTDPVRHIA